jgi:type I restriction enzyme S subunit
MTELLPKGWALATVDELSVPGGVTDGPFGSNLKTEHYTPTGPRVVRLQNIGDGRFVDERAHISEAHFERLAKHEVVAGDVLVASLGELLPRACLAPALLGPAIVKADCIRVRPHPEISAPYLMRALNSPGVRAAVGASIKGVGRPRVNLGDLRQLQIPVASPAEQERIVAAIEEAFSKLDAGEAGLRTVRQLLKRMREAVLAAAVTGRLVSHDPTDTPAAAKLLADLGINHRHDDGLGESPAGWASADISDLVEPGRRIAYGVLQPGGDVGGGVQLVRVMDLADGAVAITQLKRISPTIAAKFPRTTLAGGEVLLSVVGTIGRVAVAPDELKGANVARAVAVLPLRSDVVLPEWIAHALRHEPWRQALEQTAHEVARKTLNLEDVRRFPLPIPPIAEQGRIVAEVERQYSFIEACERAVDAGLARSAALRRSVLKAAFEGRLVAQDPSDEPAAVLLERIRRAREASPAPVSRRRPRPAAASQR